MIPTLIATVATVCVVALARRQGWGWSAPMILYSLIWTLAIGIYELRLFPFYDLTAYTWTIIAVAFLGFVSAAFLGGRVPLPASSVRVEQRFVVMAMRAYLAAGLIGAVWYFWQIHEVFGITAILTNSNAVHKALTDRVLGSQHLFLYYLGIAGTVLFGYLWLSARRRPEPVDLMLLGAFGLSMAVYTERTHVLWALACWMFMVVAPPHRDRALGRLVAIAGVATALGLGFYLAAGQWLGKSPANITNSLIIVATLADPHANPEAAARMRMRRYVPSIERDVPPTARLRTLLPGGSFYPFSVLYMSVAATLPTLDRGLALHERSYGQLTFRPLARPLARLGILPELQRLTTYDDVLTPYPANAYGYLYEHVRDFGTAGAVVFPVLFGFLAGLAYRRVTAVGGYWAVWLAMLNAMILWSTFRNHFVSTVSAYVVVALLVPPLASKLLPRRLDVDA